MVPCGSLAPTLLGLGALALQAGPPGSVGVCMQAARCNLVIDALVATCMQPAQYGAA